MSKVRAGGEVANAPPAEAFSKLEFNQLTTDDKYQAHTLTIRFLAVICLLLNICVCVCAWVIAAMPDFGEKLERSEWQYIFASMNTVLVFYNIHDVVITFKNTALGAKGLITHEMNHRLFVRASIPASTHILTLFPNILTFMLVANGAKFSEGATVNSVTEKFFGFHIAVFCCMLVFTCGVFAYLRYKLRHGRFQRNPADCASMSGKAFLGMMAVCAVFFCIGLVYACTVKLNSGIVILTVLEVPTAFVVVVQGIRLALDAYPKKREWIVTFRALVGIHIGLAYMAFWVSLVILIINSTNDQQDFFETIGKLSSNRKLTLACYFVAWCLFMAFYAVRVFFAKLRKNDRLPRIVPAAPYYYDPKEAAGAQKQAVEPSVGSKMIDENDSKADVDTKGDVEIAMGKKQGADSELLEEKKDQNEQE